MMSPTRTVLAMVLLAFVVVPVGAQSLAEAAAAAAKVKHEWPASTNTGPTKVITNKDLSPDPLTSSSVAAVEPGGTKVIEPVLSGAGGDAKNEDYWRARLRPLTAQLTTDLAVLAPLQIRHAELQSKFYNMNTVFQQQLVAPEMFRIQTQLKTAGDVVAADTRAIDDVKEQGRKAGALPGWFR